MPIYTIVGNLIDRTPKMNGIGVTVDEVYTLNTVDRHGVVVPVHKLGGGVDIEDPAQYVARRITPKECARLQGMPDDWCAKVPHKDSAEYKLWGNGMALPCILYFIEGAAEVLKRRQLEELFNDTDEKGA